MTPTLQELGIDKLSPAQRLDLIGAIWETLTPQWEMPDWHREELDRRLARADANPNGGIPWEHVRAELRGET